MKIKNICFFICVFVVGFSASFVHGADCEQRITAISKERNFIERKRLVEEAFQACPNNAKIVFKYAFSQERYGKLDVALKYYTKAAVLNPKMAKAFFCMADVYVALGDKKLAIMAYDKGLRIEPTNVRAIMAKTSLVSEL